MKTPSIILLFLTLIACNKVYKGNLIPLGDLHNERLYKHLDSLPKDLYRIYRLDLSDNNLDRIPDIVFQMTNLQELDVSNNQITEIDKIAQLDKLQILNIGMNKISRIPEEINHLKYLKVFNLYWNDVQSFPDSFYDNVSIEELDMTSMFEFDFLSNMPKFHRLTNLRRLNLGNNQIPDLKIRFSGLVNLTEFGYIRQEKINLRELILDLDSCPRLKTIHLSVNNII